MKIKISDIRINPGRRSTDQQNVEELAKSIKAVGLMNPITIDQNHTLIAGLHRMEAAKLLGWTEIECTVSDAEGIQAELAEIDENIVRARLSRYELGEQLLRRKEIYETLHPETRHGMRNGQTSKDVKLASLETKSFNQDTSEKLNMSKRSVARLVQIANNTTPEAKQIIQKAGAKVTQDAALKISRLPPDQQEEAAAVLAVAPPTPKKQTMMDGEAALTEFKALCRRYISGIESLYNQKDIFAGMTTFQFDELSDSAYAVTNAIKEFFQEVNAIRHEGENDNEN